MKAKGKTAKTKCSVCNKPISVYPGDEPVCSECAKKKSDEDKRRKEPFEHKVCADCGKRFYVTVGQHEFMQQKGLDDPKRCYECRQKRKQERENNKGEADEN